MGYETHDGFWQRVMFFNYLPECVGGAGEHFNHGTQEQISRAKDRFLRLIQQELPDKVLVFTSRRWAFPFDAETFQKLGSRFSNFYLQEYRFDGHSIPISFLRYPQGASGELMRGAIEFALDYREPQTYESSQADACPKKSSLFVPKSLLN